MEIDQTTLLQLVHEAYVNGFSDSKLSSETERSWQNSDIKRYLECMISAEDA